MVENGILKFGARAFCILIGTLCKLIRDPVLIFLRGLDTGVWVSISLGTQKVISKGGLLFRPKTTGEKKMSLCLHPYI